MPSFCQTDSLDDVKDQIEKEEVGWKTKAILE